MYIELRADSSNHTTSARMATAARSCVDSMFIAPGCRKTPVHHAWQDVTAAEHDPIMRVLSMHTSSLDRRSAPGVVAGLRARASQAMMMDRCPAKEEKKRTDSFGILHASIRNPTSTAQFKDSLYGHALRIHPAASSHLAKFQNRPLSGLVSDAVRSHRSTSPQRPHTAPAKERKFRRSTVSLQQKLHVDSASAAPETDVVICDSPGQLQPSRVQIRGNSHRANTKASSIHSPALGPTWQRRMRGVTEPGDLSERRAGRSRSTEPVLLRKLTGVATTWNGEASITDVEAKSHGRPRMKAPVDCWWEERQGRQAPPAKSKNLFNLGKGQGPRMRSSSAGRHKQRISNCNTSEAAATEVQPSGSRKRESRQPMRLTSPQAPSRDCIGSREHEASRSRRRRSGSFSCGASQHACVSREPQICESGVKNSDMPSKGGTGAFNSNQAHQTGIASLQGIRGFFGLEVNEDAGRAHGCASTVTGDTDVTLLEVSTVLPQHGAEVTRSASRSGSLQILSSQESGLMTVNAWTGRPEGNSRSRLTSLVHGNPRHGRSSCLPGPGQGTCMMPGEWDDILSERGELQTLQCSLHCLASDLGITDRWCYSLCQELLDSSILSESDNEL